MESSHIKKEEVELLNADKAFELTTEIMEKKAINEMEIIQQKINKAIEQGSFYIEVFIKHEKNLDAIIDAGYRIGDSVRDKTYTEISWDFKNNPKLEVSKSNIEQE